MSSRAPRQASSHGAGRWCVLPVATRLFVRRWNCVRVACRCVRSIRSSPPTRDSRLTRTAFGRCCLSVWTGRPGAPIGLPVRACADSGFSPCCARLRILRRACARPHGNAAARLFPRRRGRRLPLLPAPPLPVSRAARDPCPRCAAGRASRSLRPAVAPLTLRRLRQGRCPSES